MNGLYQLFKGWLYSNNLFDFLSGYEPGGGEIVSEQDYFIPMCLWMLGISIVLAAFFYLLNSAKFNQLKHWIVLMVVAFALNFGYVILVCNHLEETNELIEDYKIEETEDGEKATCNGLDYSMLGLANGLLSCLVFFVASMGLKNLPNAYNVSHIPFGSTADYKKKLSK